GLNFQFENPQATLAFNFGGSNLLRAQLDQDLGANADVFASADQGQMDLALQNGDLTGNPQIFAYNILTIIVPVDNPSNIQSVCDLAGPGVRFVTSLPDVPIGQYAEAMLLKAALACGPGFVDQVHANTVSQASDVSEIVSMVQSGAADAGV